MTEDKGILIKNIYYMLSYAYKTLRQNNFESIATEEFDEIKDLFAAILAKGVAEQLKKGLYREYVSKSESLSTLRGKLDIQATIKNKLQHRQVLGCEYDELSENNLMNQIIKTSAIVLIREKTVKKEHKSELKKLLLFFSNIDEIEPKFIRWDKVRFTKNSRSYEMLINLSYIILHDEIHTTDSGETKLMGFLTDDLMSSLYENFLREYYRYHYSARGFDIGAPQIPWNFDDGYSDILGLLSTMRTDITIRHKSTGKTLIMDAKYYSSILGYRFNKGSYHSGNLYQIFTYVKNMDRDNTGNVSGMLMYAKTSETEAVPSEYSIGGNKIAVGVLDLGTEWNEIKNQLDEVMVKYFT